MAKKMYLKIHFQVVLKFKLMEINLQKFEHNGIQICNLVIFFFNEHELSFACIMAMPSMNWGFEIVPFFLLTQINIAMHRYFCVCFTTVSSLHKGTWSKDGNFPSSSPSAI